MMMGPPIGYSPIGMPMTPAGYPPHPGKPHHGIYRPTEKIVDPEPLAGYFAYQLRSSTKSKHRVDFGNVEFLLQHFVSRCKEPDFHNFCTNHGLIDPTFQYRVPAFKLQLRFQSAITKIETKAVTVALAFHGTRPTNIDDILQQGLDPKRRSNQSFGPGEYFAKNPGPSRHYCRGGFRILVFLIVVPTMQSRSKRREIVVVENNHHQLPIGFVDFISADGDALQRSKDVAQYLGNQAKEAEIKASIIQLFIQKEIESARYKYNKHLNDLSIDCKKEIILFAMDFVPGMDDDETLAIYFPIKGCSYDEIREEKQVIMHGVTLTVDEMQKRAANAKADFEKLKKGHKRKPAQAEIPCKKQK
jgi:hypothetical protein